MITLFWVSDQRYRIFSRDKFVGHSFFFLDFFSEKIDISFINSIFSGEIKNNPPKKQFFHLLKYIPKKCVKTKLSGELKKYGNFDWTVKNIEKNIKNIEKNIIDQSHIVHKTWQHLYPLDLWNVAVSSGRFIYMLSSITTDTTTLPRRCDTPRLIVPRFFWSLKKMPPIQLYSISVRNKNYHLS